ncbi:MAG: hypothetical protein LBR25_07285 [Erysipelotrichaceae bacterium]|nr:hypothetical protein [Erysipelotrichaceae bacterium]
MGKKKYDHYPEKQKKHQCPKCKEIVWVVPKGTVDGRRCPYCGWLLTNDDLVSSDVYVDSRGNFRTFKF